MRADFEDDDVAQPLRNSLTPIFEESLMNGTLISKERGMSVPPVIPQRDERRTQALKTALDQIEKQFGKGSIMRLGADTRLATASFARSM